MKFFRLWFELPSVKVIGCRDVWKRNDFFFFFFLHDYSFNNLTLLRVSVQKKVSFFPYLQT